MSFKNIVNKAEEINNEMFSDSKSRDTFDTIKKRITYKNGVKEGTTFYSPEYDMNPVNTAGLSIYDGYSGAFHDSVIIAENREQLNAITRRFDDDAFSIPSSGNMSYFTTVFTTKFIEAITRKTVFDKISSNFQQGIFGTTNIKIPALSSQGNYALYSDYGSQGNTGMNLNWVDRQIVDFERTLNYGDKAVAQMGAAKIDYINRLRTSLMDGIRLHQDAIGFYGYNNNMQIHGLLNDPSLNPTINAGIKAGGQTGATTLWAYGTFDEIVSDVRRLVTTIISRAGGNVDTETPMSLLLAPAVYGYITQISAYSKSVVEQLKALFPNMEIIQAPLLQGTSSGSLPIGSGTPNQAVLIVNKIKGENTILNSFVTLYNSHGVIRSASSNSEKISYSLGGAVIVMPIGVQIMTGV